MKKEVALHLSKTGGRGQVVYAVVWDRIDGISGHKRTILATFDDVRVAREFIEAVTDTDGKPLFRLNIEEHFCITSMDVARAEEWLCCKEGEGC
jgi:hypothetical protein